MRISSPDGKPMKLFAPQYYKKFKCIADRCTHSCCVGWEIDVDSDTLERYGALAGALGTRVRQSLEAGEDGVHFALRPDGRCPHLDDRGLCEIIKGAGEGYLCEICREHPRFYNVVGNRMECGIGASCQAAAALILHEPYAETVCLGEEICLENRDTCCEFDAISARNDLYCLLSDSRSPYAKRLELIRERFAVPAQIEGEAWRGMLEKLEYLDERHKALFLACGVETCEGHETVRERFLAYLVYRHASPAECAREFGLAVGVALVLERLFAALIAHGLSPVEAAVTVSEEIEYSEDNTEAIRLALTM